ncbi:MAG: fused MFS/spermidine synthase [Acidobacteriia bacterium]|nr:fused MFS/spermidine synthase [Terriglobia bacterium]
MATTEVLSFERIEKSAQRGMLPLILYGMTGFTGLLAEQGLEKYITLLVGATATASAVVVFTYFLGFALGGLVTAQFLKRGRIRKPLRTYAILELLVGISCILFSFLLHPLIEILAPLQNLAASELGKYAVRFGCGCLLVLPIAALMGASFPLIAQALNDERSRDTRNWSLAYSGNLAGALLAALVTPYFVIPAIGLRGAMWICLAICSTVAALGFSQMEDSAASASNEDSLPRGSDSLRRGSRPGDSMDADTAVLLTASFLSGAVFFALEIVWTHLIGAVIGGSVYAFSAMLATVLMGLLAGSWIANRPRAIRTSFILQLCAVTLVIQFWMWDLVPVLFVIPAPIFYQTFFARELYRFAVTALLIVPSATTLGMIYPRLLRNPLGERDGHAWLAGYLGASNALGCLIGALVATFVLIPTIGSENSIKLVILTLAGLCLVFRFREPRAGSSPRAVAVLSVAMFAVATIPRHWEWQSLTSGAAMYFGEASGPAGTPPVQSRRSIVFRDEQIQGGFTTVVEEKFADGRAVHSMYSNGKLQGNDDPEGDLPIQFGVAAIPALFATHFDRALLIGLGTGHTAGVLKELGFKDLQIAELSPGIVRAAGADFTPVNHGILTDPTVKYTLEDGRNLLLTSVAPRYDLITVELTAIWFSGATNLYSKEFYELANRRLEPDGVLQQWVQLHRISPREVASAIATARSVFPYVSFWSYAGQGMLLAANHPLVQPDRRLDELAERLSAAEHMQLEHARSIVETVSLSELVSPAGVAAMVRETNPVITTDHNRFIEYATPQYSSAERDWRAYNIRFLKGWNR